MHFLKIATIAVPLCLSGCGTIANINGMNGALMGEIDKIRPRPFGGAANDLAWTYEVYWPIKPLLVLDLPVSLAADVITLPMIGQSQREWDRRHQDADVNPPADNPGTTSESN